MPSRCLYQGIWTQGAIYFTAERNIVGACGGAGIVIEDTFDPHDDAELRNNTVFRNGGAGIVWNVQPLHTAIVEGNIGFENGGWGLAVRAGARLDVRCNDWFGNVLGTVGGGASDSADLRVDPAFCNVDSADVGLDSGSALAAAGSCGQIGALGVGCGITATLVRRFEVSRVKDCVQVVWQVAEGVTASEVWLERSETMEGGSWVRPLSERSIENGAVVELDRTTAAGRTYWYRLMALEGIETVVIGPPLAVGAQALGEFRLAEVGPSPGDGPVRIAFALQRAATIEICVFDLQGRRVASLASGAWPVGTHVVKWEGRARGGSPAPVGVYVVRYVYPGGQDKRAIVVVK